MEIVVGYRGLKSFEASQFKWVTRETRYHVSIVDFPGWFFFNKSETVKAVTLAFSGIQ